MGDPSEGGELTPTSGEGQCEMRVCDTDGEPRCHVAEPTGDVCLARLRTVTHPQVLSMETLQGARDGLEQCRELGEQLGSCLDLALEKFRREPRCVQENARLLIRWGGGEHELLSGEGQCEISVLLADGEPQYHITALGGDRPVTWSHASPELLSVTDLARVRDRLGCWGALGEELSSCFGEAISQFSREPPCVQENVRLRLCWDRGSLEFLSGQGQYTFSVSYQEGNPRYHFHVETLPVHLYVARLHSRNDPLTADSLLKFHAELGLCQGDTAALRACLHRAWEGFSQEPRCVQENARLLIRWDGQELEFVSGQGQCEISVLLADGEPQYHITELGGDRTVTWSHTSPEPLSVADLARVRDRLGRWGALGEELSGCFGEAISRFSQEPPCVQENARLRIRWDGGTLELLSGEGQCEISVCCRDRRPQYEVGELPMHMYAALLRTRPEPLSAETLQRVLRKLGSCQEDTSTLRACISHALDQFVQEPWCVQENARLLIQSGGGELEFVSGQGQCEISVLLADGEPQYHITALGGDRPVTWSHTSPEPLSVADLVRVWDRLGRWGARGEELSSCFGEAISQFSWEPPCVQENARMRIHCDRNRLEFLSGEGQCEISVLLTDGEPQYHITALGGDRPVTWSHTSPDPLSIADLARVWDRLGRWGALGEGLSGCFAEAISQFSREPPCVQGNARLRIYCDRNRLEFLSGEGQCEISVRYRNRRAQYEVGELPGHIHPAQLHTVAEPENQPPVTPHD